MSANVEEIQIFDKLSSIITNLHFSRRTQNDLKTIGKTLDDLNALNYKNPTCFINETKAILLVNQCCTLICTDNEALVTKFCFLLINLIVKQNVKIRGPTLGLLLQWLLRCLEYTQDSNILLILLEALDSLIRKCNENQEIPLIFVVKQLKGFLAKMGTSSGNNEVILCIFQCFEACTIDFNEGNEGKIKPKSKKDEKQIVEEYSDLFDNCFTIFTNFLMLKHNKSTDLINIKISIICFNGIQNIINQKPGYLKRDLGLILGLIKTYMVYGIDSIKYLDPQKILPSTLSVPEASGSVPREKKGGKLTKQRKHKSNAPANKEFDDHVGKTVYTAANRNFLDVSFQSPAAIGGKTSDSDFSDTECGKLSQFRKSNTRLRRGALNLFYVAIKLTEKQIMFSYWTSFIPETSLTTGQHNLISCILKDPSIKGRVAALNVLLLMLTSSKLYLAQAEMSEKSSFTPFSVTLGLMLTEIHKCLSKALNFHESLVLTQVLKCFSALVQATPYHRMTSGTLSQVVRRVRKFIYHKDVSVQVTALITLGCVLATEPILPETEQILLKFRDGEADLEDANRSENEESKKTVINPDEFDFAQFSSDDETCEEIENPEESSSIPWLLKRCLENLGVAFHNQVQKSVAAPIKLESLQVISAMSRNYFKLMSAHLALITEALQMALMNAYTDLKLHAGWAVDFLGQAIHKFLLDHNDFLDQSVQFWTSLLNGPLINLFQSEQQNTLRAIGCDCLSSIGGTVYQQLPRDKQILCISLLFSCARDEEKNVKAAGVRALAICVLYPTLREDAGFVADTCEAIYETLQDDNLTVLIKAYWSLGNLSEALVLNLKSHIQDEIPDELMLKLLQISISGAQKNDRIKMHAVRAVGNLLFLMTENLVQNARFFKAIEEGLIILKKNCTSGANMKARWNSCYALANAMRNANIYPVVNGVSTDIFTSLMSLVESFRNFKVRISAAVALAAPSAKNHYGAFFISVWEALLKALENSQNIEDFSEYKHRDYLVDQICLTLSHLTLLLEKDDFQQLKEIILHYGETLNVHMHKVMERLVPEKSEIVYLAASFLNQLSSKENLTQDEKMVLTCLNNAFKYDL